MANSVEEDVLTRFTRMFNLTGNPALVLPCGLTQTGLPIGLQIVGAHWQEQKISQVAEAIERARRAASPQQ